MEPKLREAAVIELLDRLPAEFNSILIGGYAVCAYGPARYSEDVDLVVPAEKSEALRAWLIQEGFRVSMTMRPSPSTSDLGKLLISKGSVKGAVFVGGVRSRDSGAVLDYPWIAIRPRNVRLLLVAGRTQSAVMVVRLEALWALKLLAARAQDLTDLFSISPAPFDAEEVSQKLKSLPGAQTRGAFRSARSFVGSDKEYLDALSRRSMGSPDSSSNIRAWETFRSKVNRVLP